MIKKTIPTSSLQKKPYAMPQMKAYQIEPAIMLTGSDGNPSATSTANEEYNVVSEEVTRNWFQ